jgi:hypothetical protein
MDNGDLKNPRASARGVVKVTRTIYADVAQELAANQVRINPMRNYVQRLRSSEK